MHPNPAYRQQPDARALEFAAERGFGALTVAGPEGVLAAHVPFLVEDGVMAGHLVRSNPLARLLKGGPVTALMVVTGPDGYISPDWYGEEDRVPTWNYVAVHLRGQLRLIGEESHSGSHSPDYGIWSRAGGGSLVGKGCHPLTALLYLKRVEGQATRGKPIRPASVTARTHKLTRIDGYRDAGFLRTDYRDIEDYGWMHVVFEDGTVGDVVTGETTLGGCYDYVEVFANNHRSRCRLNPVSMLDLYNPKHEQMADLYLVEKLSSNEGWSPVSANEHYTMGYQDEMQDFVTCAATGREPICGLDLAVDTMTVIYSAYLSDERSGAEVALS